MQVANPYPAPRRSNEDRPTDGDAHAAEPEVQQLEDPEQHGVVKPRVD